MTVTCLLGGSNHNSLNYFESDILPNNPRNQPYRHIPLFIDPCDHKTDIILFPRHPAVITAMGDSVDANLEPDENSALVDVRDRSGIFALDLALAEVGLAGIAIHALYIRADRDVLQGADLDAQDAYQDLITHMETLCGISHPVPG